MKYTIPRGAHVVDVMWPGREFIYENNIVTWTDGLEPVPREEIESAKFNLLKQEMEELIRATALSTVSTLTAYAIGSSDMRQIYVYDLKRAEAKWLIDTGADLELANPETTPERRAEILSNVHMLAFEAPLTGAEVWELAAVVISQYDMAQSILNGVFGQVEAVRRLNVAAIKAATSYEELDAIPEPEWPSFGDVTPF